MNVLLICGDDHYYGSAQAAISLLKYTNEHCPEIRYTVVTQTMGAINELCDRLGIENYATGHAYSVVAMERSAVRSTFKRFAKKVLVSTKNRRALSKIEKLIDMSRIDLIHTNIDRDTIGCSLSKKYSIPHVMHLREFATGHYNVEPLYEGQYKAYNRYVDRYVAISKAVGENWKEIGLDARKVRVVYDGIDVSKVQQREAPVQPVSEVVRAQCEAEPRRLKLVMCGDISSLKGQDQAIRALIGISDKQVRKNITLDLFGEVHREKEYGEELKALMKESGLEDNVSFCGYSTELDTQLKDYDCGIVCTKREGFGLATAEFMAAGLAVIACDTGANQELIQDGVNGRIFHYQDTDDLAEKILELYRQPEVADQYGRNSRRIVEECFSIEANCKGILQIYKSC